MQEAEVPNSQGMRGFWLICGCCKDMGQNKQLWGVRGVFPLQNFVLPGAVAGSLGRQGNITHYGKELHQ